MAAIKRDQGCLPLLVCICVLLFYHPMTCLIVETININGAKDIRKRACVFELAKVKKNDALFIQVTPSDYLDPIN